MPWIRDKKIKFWQTRATLKSQYPKYDSSEGSEKDIFNYDMIDITYPYIFMLEGAFDSIWVKNGIALAGVSITPHQSALLDTFNMTKVWMFDNQWQDKTAKDKSLKIFTGSQQDRVFIWPKEIKAKDINELILDDPSFINRLSDVNWMSSNVYSGARGKVLLTFNS